MIDLKNKTAIVTGGAMGIGLATAKRLIREGCLVTIWDIDEAALTRAEKDIAPHGGKLFHSKGDVSNNQQVLDLVAQAKKDMGRIDILVNNAGILTGGHFVDHPVETWERITQVNQIGMYYTIHAILPDMLQRNSGHIVNVSSAGGLIGAAGLATYCATKWAIMGLTESLRMETMAAGKTGVKFSSIHPMYIREGMAAGAKLNFLGRLIVPNIQSHDVVALDIVEKALKKQRQVVKNPKTVHLTYLMRAFLPPAWANFGLYMLGLSSSMDGWAGHGDSSRAA